MDRQTRTFDAIKALNAYHNNALKQSDLLNEVCDYFDFIKNEQINQSDLRFLMYLSNKVGVPHYYDLLYKFNHNIDQDIDDENIGLDIFSALLYEASLYTDEYSQLHKYQKDILDLFKLNETNRYFLSASTSFGKTHLVYEIIKK